MLDKLPGELLYSEEEMTLPQFVAYAIRKYAFHGSEITGNASDPELMRLAIAQINRAINNKEFTRFKPEEIKKIIEERTGLKVEYVKGEGFRQKDQHNLGASRQPEP